MTAPNERRSGSTQTHTAGRGTGLLTRLPNELLVLVAEFLQFPDILNFAQTNRRNLGACANGITREKELLYKYRDVYLGPALGIDNVNNVDLLSSSLSSSFNLHRNIYSFFGVVSQDARYNYVRNINMCLDPIEEGRDEIVDTVFMSVRPTSAEDRALCKVLQRRLEKLDVPCQDLELSRHDAAALPVLPDLLFHASVKGNGEALFAASMPLFTNLKCLTFVSRIWDGPHCWDCIDKFFQVIARMAPQTYLMCLDSLIWDPCTSSAFQNIRSIMALPSLRYARLQGCHERNDDESAEFTWPEGCPDSNLQEIVMKDPRISKAGLERVLGRVNGPCVVRAQGTSLWRQDEDTRWKTCTKMRQADGTTRVVYA